MNRNKAILSCYAVTPCHAGSGAAVGVVDLPIQRERHTQWPVVASSGLKGALRAHFDRHKMRLNNLPEKTQHEQLTDLVFGSASGTGHAGALSVSDLKILAFPMRSNVAPFVWITCPAALKRLARDLALIDKDKIDPISIPSPAREEALCWSGDIKDEVLLEEMEVKVMSGASIPAAFQTHFEKAERLLVVHDEVFSYGVTYGTSVVAQIAIDQATGTTKTGSLRYQEELPQDTLMYAVVFFEASRDGKATVSLESIYQWMTQDVVQGFVQVGGDETCGRGIFEVCWL